MNDDVSGIDVAVIVILTAILTAGTYSGMDNQTGMGLAVAVVLSFVLALLGWGFARGIRQWLRRP